MRLWLLLLLAAYGHASRAQPVAPVARANVAAAPRRFPDPVNVHYMVSGYFFAGAKKSRGVGNFTSNNMPRPLARIGDVRGRLGHELQVIALDDQERSFLGHVPLLEVHDGFRVVVVNPTKRPIELNAEDSRLDIVHEAIDRSGMWAPIEQLPHSWCGHSYHTLTLPPKSYWEFTVPRYDGTFETTLRIRMTIWTGNKLRVLYSNEFRGRINPSQFTGKHSITDGYVD